MDIDIFVPSSARTLHMTLLFYYSHFPFLSGLSVPGFCTFRRFRLPQLQLCYVIIFVVFFFLFLTLVS